MSCGCYIQLDTPQSIMDTGNDYYNAGTDIFATIFTGTSFLYAAQMQAILWQIYRNIAIGGCDTEVWVIGMRDRLKCVGSKWDDIFAEMLETAMAGTTDRDYERIVKHEPIENTVGDLRTVRRTGTVEQDGSNTGTVTTVDTPTGSDQSVEEHENMPQTQVNTLTDRYVDARVIKNDTPAVIRTNQRTDNIGNTSTTENDLTDTETYVPNTKDTETFKANDTIPSVTFSQMLDAYPDIPYRFAHEFSDHFILRWYRWS